MSSLQQIETAISQLSVEDRAKLVHDLPRLLPEWEGDLAWQRILHDPGPSPKLTAFVDCIDAEFQRNPENFPEITESDFKRKS